jgi:hypothetical protein
MAEDMNDQEIVWKLRALIFEGDPRDIMAKARELLAVTGREGQSPTASEAVKKEVYEIGGQVAKLAQRLSERANEDQKQLQFIAEQVVKLGRQIYGEEKVGRIKEEREKQTEEEKKRKAWYREKDERDLA